MQCATIWLSFVLWGCSSAEPATEDVGGDSPTDAGGDGGGADTGAGPGDSGEPIDDADPEDVPGVTRAGVGVLLIRTGGQEIPDGAKISAEIEVISQHDGTLDDLDAAPRDWVGPIGIELHGSSSLGYPKLPYKFEVRDDAGEDIEVGLLGMEDGSDWVLHAPYSDKTLIRNALSYDLGRSLAEESDQWQPHTAFTELFIDGEYLGVYVLTERVRRDGDRVDLPAVAASADVGDLTGGYIVKADQHRSAGFTTNRGSLVDYAYPRASVITGAQASYIVGWFNDLEAGLESSSWDAGHSDWLIQDSWVDHYIINELAHNIDAYRLSAYVHKYPDDQGGRLVAGPLWDFDRAWANVDYCDAWYPDGFVMDSLTDCGYGYQYPSYWVSVTDDPAFQDAVRCRWESLRLDRLSDDTLGDRIAALAGQVADAERRDNAQWDTIGTWVSPNSFVGETWEEELGFLEEWTLQRAAWLDRAFPGTCAG